MSSAAWVTGPCIDVMDALPEGSIDLILTSPPYPWQRDYLDPADPAKAVEIGQPVDPAGAVSEQLAWLDSAFRVLAPHGVAMVNFGQHHSGSGGSGGDYNPGGPKEGRPKSPGTAKKARTRYRNDRMDGGPMRDRAVDEDLGIIPVRFRWRDRGTPPRDGWPREQSICWIPELLAASMAYGVNLLTGNPCEMWVTRAPRTWCKPSATPGRLTRGFRVATETVLVLGKDQAHWWDVSGVRRPLKHGTVLAGRTQPELRDVPGQRGYKGNPERDGGRVNSHPLGVPPVDWIEVNSASFDGSHFAVMPDALCFDPVDIACPERVCTTCGSPWRRLVLCHSCGAEGHDEAGAMLRFCTCDPTSDGAKRWERRTDWWTPCDHDTWRPGRVLDPFAGTGTVGVVATGRGRDAVLIDLDHRNVELARRRLGLFIDEPTVDELAVSLAVATADLEAAS